MGKKTLFAIIILAVCLALAPAAALANPGGAGSAVRDAGQIGVQSELAATTSSTPLVVAGEDAQPPVVKSVQVLNPTINAGSDLQIKVEVEESGTGLTHLYVQVANGDEHYVNRRTLDLSDWLGVPQYSSGTNFIPHTFTLHIPENMPNGDWFVEDLEVFDAKGNYIQYRGSADNNYLRNVAQPSQQAV